MSNSTYSFSMTELFARQILAAAACSDEPIDVNEKEDVPINADGAATKTTTLSEF